MTNEINEIIKKNLPQQVGEILQKELARIPQLEKDLLDAKNAYNIAQSENREAQAELKQLKELKLEMEALRKERADIEERQRNLKVTLLEKDLAAAQSINTNSMEILKGLVRNTNFRKTVFGTEPIAIDGSQNCGGYVAKESFNKPTDKTTD